MCLESNFKTFKLFLLLYIIFAVFLFPMPVIPHLALSFVLFIFSIFIDLFLYESKIKFLDLLIIMGLIIYILVEGVFINSDIIRKLTTIFYLLLLVFYNNTNKKIFYSNKTFIIIIISFLFQIFIFGSNNNRYLMGIGDPNFAGLMFYFLFIMLNKRRKKVLAILLLFIGLILFQSRSLLLAGLIFYSIRYFKSFLSKPIKWLKLDNFVFINIILIGLLILFSYFYVDNVFNINGNLRLLEIQDSSNYVRFNDYLRAVEFIKKNNFNTYFGLNSEAELKFIDRSRADSNHVRLMPHNDILKFIIIHGIIFTIIYYISIAYFINPHFHKKNYEYIYSYISYSIFLHSIFFGFNLLFFMVIIMDDNIK